MRDKGQRRWIPSAGGVGGGRTPGTVSGRDASTAGYPRTDRIWVDGEPRREKVFLAEGTVGAEAGVGWQAVSKGTRDSREGATGWGSLCHYGGFPTGDVGQ